MQLLWRGFYSRRYGKVSNETRDDEGVSRRDFLGLASLWALILSSLTVLAGIFRMTKADVYYEESRKFEIGKPEEFPPGTVRKIDDKRVFIFADNEGFYAVSSICTHLGCIVHVAEEGFQCPCHGSKFNKNGNVMSGPAPRNLPWLEMSRHVDGNLVVDASREIQTGTKFKV
jgi:cytochrome b6-f complex iron-sulfur subunit